MATDRIVEAEDAAFHERCREHPAERLGVGREREYGVGGHLGAAERPPAPGRDPGPAALPDPTHIAHQATVRDGPVERVSYDGEPIHASTLRPAPGFSR